MHSVRSSSQGSNGRAPVSGGKPVPNPNRRTLSFLVVTAFLNSLGVGIIAPVLPFVAGSYVHIMRSLAAAAGWLGFAFGLSLALAIPLQYALSDRFGRRPVLLVGLLLSAAGYLVFGIGGRLWLLYLGRVLCGLGGGSIAVLAACLRETAAPQQRVKLFSALAAGQAIGLAVGPLLGGMAAPASYTAAVFFAAALTACNMLWGCVVAKESLPRTDRAPTVRLQGRGPFAPLRGLASSPELTRVVAGTALVSLALSGLLSCLPVMLSDRLRWDADGVGPLMFVLLAVSLVVSAGLLRRWIPLIEPVATSIGGMACAGAGFLLLAIVAAYGMRALLVAAILAIAIGDGLLRQALERQASGATTRVEEQARDGAQAVRLLAYALGPLLAGELYTHVGRPAPFLVCALCAVLAGVTQLPASMLPTAERD